MVTLKLFETTTDSAKKISRKLEILKKLKKYLLFRAFVLS